MRDRVIDRQELLNQLRLPPRTVRRLIESYREWLSAPQSGRFTALDLARLQIAARMTLAGRPKSAILDALSTTRPQEDEEEGAASLRMRARSSAPNLRPQREGGPEDEPSEPLPARAEAAAASEALAVPTGPEPLVDEIGKLREVIMQNVERERQDRDRVLMALVRTQQEVSHLRSEIGTIKSRRDRKRSLMHRFLG